MLRNFHKTWHEGYRPVEDDYLALGGATHSMPHEYIMRLLDLRRERLVPPVWVDRGRWYIQAPATRSFGDAERIAVTDLMALIVRTEQGRRA